MALGFSPLTLNKSKGGEIMSDYEIIHLVIMIGCDLSRKKKH